MNPIMVIRVLVLNPFIIELGTILDSCVGVCHLFSQLELLEDPQSKSLILIGGVYV